MRSRSGEKKIEIVIISFGYKYGDPPICSLLFDVRFLPNPFYVQGLRARDGLDNKVSSYVFAHAAARRFTARAFRMVCFLAEQFSRKQVTQLRVAIGCTGGRHRSVAIARRVADLLIETGYSVGVEHRNIDGEAPRTSKD